MTNAEKIIRKEAIHLFVGTWREAIRTQIRQPDSYTDTQKFIFAIIPVKP